jgi:hypothetical protein
VGQMWIGQRFLSKFVQVERQATYRLRSRVLYLEPQGHH